MLDESDEFSVFGYYAPASMRLVQASARPELFTKVNQMLPGPGKQMMRNQSSDANAEHTDSVTVVVFIGGCTWGEVSALRALGKQTNKRYLIVTSGIVTGGTLMDSFKCTFKDAQYESQSCC